VRAMLSNSLREREAATYREGLHTDNGSATKKAPSSISPKERMSTCKPWSLIRSKHWLVQEKTENWRIGIMGELGRMVPDEQTEC